MILNKFKLINLMLSALLILSVLTACNPKSEFSISQTGIYNFKEYECNDVFNIEEVNLSRELSQKCSTYKFTYLSDKYKIKAYISFPISAIDSQKPSKCILYNRGGNSKIGLLEDSTTANLCIWSNRIVVASQYRGAGESEGIDQFGGDDLNDIIQLINICQNNFKFIDMDDFCVAGVSRGGMMTYMSARYDNRIKRIISVSGVSDLFQSYYDREDMRKILPNYIGYSPQENPTEYENRSAIYWYDEIKIPVLMIHSKYDKAVSYQQTEALYAKMKHTTDCTLIIHEDDIHGIHYPDDLTTINKWLNNQ